MEQTGSYGTIANVGGLRSWTITKTFANTKQVASNTKDGTNREQGPFDWSGSYSAYGHTPAYMPGEYVNLTLYKNPDAAGATATGEILSGIGLVNSVVITWDWKTNAPISHVVNFGGHGDLTESSGAPYTDASAPTFFPPCVGHVLNVLTPTPKRVALVSQAVLTISKEMKTAVNSGSTTGTGKCTTKRYPGSGIDWTLALTRDEGNIDADLKEGQTVELKLYVDASNFWHLQWGLVGDQTGITVNRETGDVISYTNNIAMKAAKAGVLGKIIKPAAGSNWWPAA